MIDGKELVAEWWSARLTHEVTAANLRSLASLVDLALAQVCAEKEHNLSRTNDQLRAAMAEIARLTALVAVARETP